MKFATVAIAAGLLLCGCAGERRRLAVNPDHGQLLEAEAGEVVGEYYLRQFPVTVYLALDADGTYEAIWVGCQGSMAAVKGAWATSGSVLSLIPAHEGPWVAGYLRNFEIRRWQGDTILVRENGRDLFDKHGPYLWTCFLRKEWFENTFCGGQSIPAPELPDSGPAGDF